MKLPEFAEITQKTPLRRSGSFNVIHDFKVTDFGTNRKLIYDFLLVINTSLLPVLHRFRDIAVDPKSLYLATPLVFNSPGGGVLLGRSRSVKFSVDVNGWPRYPMP